VCANFWLLANRETFDRRRGKFKTESFEKWKNLTFHYQVVANEIFACQHGELIALVKHGKCTQNAVGIAFNTFLPGTICHLAGGNEGCYF